MDELLAGLAGNATHGLSYKSLKKEMEFDFKRPPFYNSLFEMWGFDKGGEWEPR
jgi:hypothetical protein